MSKTPARNVALLLDAENIGSRFVRGALEVARSEGDVVVAKAYGPASVIGSKSWEAVLQREGLDSHICTGCRKGKNSVDMHIAVDAMQMVLQLGIDVLIVVSSDCDFAPLAARVRQQGKRFHGIGQKLPTSTYPFLCDKWTNLVEIEDAPSDLGSGMLKKIERAARDSGVEEGVLIDLVECAQMRSMKGQWVDVSQLSNDVRLIRPDFNPKACGCASFKKLLEKTKLFEFSSAGTVIKVRLKAA
ncbi:MAG: NYN domain-containing protein [Coriobacteriales bacterium]